MHHVRRATTTATSTHGYNLCCYNFEWLVICLFISDLNIRLLNIGNVVRPRGFREWVKDYSGMAYLSIRYRKSFNEMPSMEYHLFCSSLVWLMNLFLFHSFSPISGSHIQMNIYILSLLLQPSFISIFQCQTAFGLLFHYIPPKTTG